MKLLFFTHELLPHQCLLFVKVIHVKNLGDTDHYKEESGTILISLPRFTKKCKTYFQPMKKNLGLQLVFILTSQT